MKTSGPASYQQAHLMAAYGLYTHIASNRLRSLLLLAGLFFLVYVMVFAGALLAEVLLDDGRAVGYYLNAAWRDMIGAVPAATIAAAAWVVIAYFFHQKLIDLVTGGRDVTRAEQPRLYNQLENLCISRGIPMPKLKVMQSPALNAFATGLNPKQYAITVTSGLLDNLDNAEVEAVLGHELTHIRNGDVQMMVVAVIIAGVIGFFGELVFRIFFNSGIRIGGGRSSSSDGDRKSGGGGAIIAILIAAALIALAWMLSQVVRFALSRSREFLADAGSVELTKNPDAMISALRKIENRGELPGATSAVMELCVDNPREGFADLFATHPSVEARVKALVRFAGGHDPGPLALPASEPQAPEEPPVHGPWGDVPPSPPPLPPGAAAKAPPGPIPGPIPGPLQGPWGRH